MIRVGINYLYWIGTGAEGDVYRILDLTKRTGADVMEYSAPMLAAMTREARRELRKKANDMGIEIALTGGMGPDFDLASEDAEQRKSSIELARKAIETATDVGSAGWCGVIYSKWFDTPKVPLTPDFRRRMWDRAVGSLKEVMKTAEAANVILSIEILNRFEAHLLTTVAEGIKFVNDIDSPCAKLLVDTFHMNIEEDCMVDTVVNAVKLDKMGHLHVSEANRRPPGLVKTDMDWDGIFKAVVDGGYDRIVSMEPFVIMESPNGVTTRTWRNLVEPTTPEGLVAAAEKSVAFVKGKLGLK